jgi:hypothetical protein
MDTPHNTSVCLITVRRVLHGILRLSISNFVQTNFDKL